MTSKLRLISRGGRVAATRIRRRPYLAGSVAFAAMLLGAGGLVSGLGEASSAAAATAASADIDAETMDSLLDARSPGSRGYGWLTNTKTARATSRPTERVLSSVRPRIPVGDIPDETPSFGTVVPADATPVGPAGAVDSVVPGGLPVGPVGAVAPGGSGGGVPGGVLPGGGGGGGGGGSTPGEPTNPTTPGTPSVPAVPEPATWAMLLMGFAILGSLMRQRRVYFLHEAR